MSGRRLEQFPALTASGGLRGAHQRSRSAGRSTPHNERAERLAIYCTAWRESRSLQEATLGRHGHRLRTGVDAQLVEDRGQVLVDRAGGKEELLADGLTGAALVHQAQHLPLARTQGIRRLGRVRRRHEAEHAAGAATTPVRTMYRAAVNTSRRSWRRWAAVWGNRLREGATTRKPMPRR